MSSITSNLLSIEQRIDTAAHKAGRTPKSVQILAVSKTHSAECVREAFGCGLTHFGENYLQEALDKQAQLTDLAISWHFIGPIQSNKTRLISQNFSWVHSVDRLKIAERLSAQRPPHLPVLNIFLQVNLDGEPSKSGCAPEALYALAQAVDALPALHLCGLMAIPAQSIDPHTQGAAFARLRTLSNQLHRPLEMLSMGMSADLEAAIAEGTHWLRIGTALFGDRSTTATGD